MEKVQSLDLTCGVKLENRIEHRQNPKPDVRSMLFTGSPNPTGNISLSVGDESPKATQAFESVHGKPFHTPSIENLVSIGFSENPRKFTREDQEKFPAETNLLNRLKVIFNLPKEIRDTLLQKQLQNSEGYNLLEYPELLIGIGHHLFSTGRTSENLALFRAAHLARSEDISPHDALALGLTPKSCSILLNQLFNEPQSAIDTDSNVRAFVTALALNRWDTVPNVPDTLLDEVYGNETSETHSERCFRFAFDWISGTNDSPCLTKLILNRGTVSDAVLGDCVSRLMKTQRFDLAAACMKAADPSLETLSAHLSSYNSGELTKEAQRLLQIQGGSVSPLWQGCLVEVLCHCPDADPILSSIKHPESFLGQIDTFNGFSIEKQKKALEAFCSATHVKHLFSILEKLSSEKVLDYLYEKLATGDEALATSLYTYCTASKKHLDKPSIQAILKRAALTFVKAGSHSKAQDLYNQLDKANKHQLYESLLNPIMPDSIMTLILAEADGSVKLYICQKILQLLEGNSTSDTAALKNIFYTIEKMFTPFYKNQLPPPKTSIQENYEFIDQKELNEIK